MNECPSCSIAQRNAAFARHLDRGDVDELVALFTEDAVYDNGRVRLEGRDELGRWLRARSGAGARTTRHIWSALQTLRASPTEIETVSTWVCYAANQDAPVDFVAVSAVADFEDVLRREGDEWLFAHRRIRGIFRDATVAPLA